MEKENKTLKAKTKIVGLEKENCDLKASADEVEVTENIVNIPILPNGYISNSRKKNKINTSNTCCFDSIFMFYAVMYAIVRIQSIQIASRQID